MFGMWKLCQYKELEVFISPFRQELAKYAEERNHLDKENKKKNAELSDLTSKLANQMGHQNQRQKIHYLVGQLRSYFFFEENALVFSMAIPTGNWNDIECCF